MTLAFVVIRVEHCSDIGIGRRTNIRKLQESIDYILVSYITANVVRQGSGLNAPGVDATIRAPRKSLS